MRSLLSRLIYRDIGIDLGTATTLIFEKGKGIVLDEPSVVAIEEATGTILAVGTEAKRMIGRAPVGVKTIRPLHEGVIADFDIAEDMLRYFFSKVFKKSLFSRPRVIICAPSGVTSVERKAVREVAEQAGASQTYVIDELMAAAIGAGLPVNEAMGSMILDIGGGTTEVGVISLGGCVHSNCIRVAGDALDEKILAYLKKNHRFLIGLSTAEVLKKELGFARLSDGSNIPVKGEEKTMDVSGRDLVSGLPKKIQVSEIEIADALYDSIQQMIDTVKDALEKTPPELASDIAQNGIVVCGGGSLIGDLDKAIAEKTRLKVIIAKSPLTCVVEGTAIALEELEILGSLRK